MQVIGRWCPIKSPELHVMPVHPFSKWFIQIAASLLEFVLQNFITEGRQRQRRDILRNGYSTTQDGKSKWWLTWGQEIIWKEEGRDWRDADPREAWEWSYGPVLQGLKFHSAPGCSFNTHEDLLKSCGDYNMIRLIMWVFDCEEEGWTKEGGPRRGPNEVEGTEVPGVFAGTHAMCFLPVFP